MGDGLCAIRECFADFYALAAEQEVEVKDVGIETLVTAGLDSAVVKSLIANLKKIGRVLIEEMV